MTPRVGLKVKVADSGGGLLEPSYATPYAGGLIVRAAAYDVLVPNTPTRVPVGFSIELPEQLCALVQCHRPAADDGIIAAPETIATDDRDEIQVLLTFVSADATLRRFIKRGDPIAELVFTPMLRVKLAEVRDLNAAPGKPRVRTLSDETEFTGA